MSIASHSDDLTRVPMSWEEYLDRDDLPGEYYGGSLVTMAPPGRIHQRIIHDLHVLLAQDLDEHWDITQGWGWSPDGVREELIPDLMVHDKTTENRALRSTPHLVVEVLSSNRRDDLVAKLNRYAQWGAPCYWIVDPRDRLVLTHELRDGYFVETGRFTGGTATLTYGDVEVPLDVDKLLG
ncbi:Uma2 family endonuclease [Nocardioides sp. NPDC101246]|uniref:Uma2 family endonuclease n=1 Tax=Nocardioides sp. NPDC101246 TaxID=3364336 RepID=UPI0038018F8F